MTAKQTVAPEVALKQFLYLSNTLGYNVFMTGNPETHNNYNRSLPFIEDFLKADNPNKLLNIIENTNGLNALPTRDTLFYVLAQVTVAATTPTFKHQVYRTVLQLIRDDVDFFNYIKFVTKQNKTFSKGINKIIARYYLSKEPKQLIRDFGVQKGYHGWTHKDLIKLAHVKSNDLFTKTVLAYVVRGPAHGKIIANGDKEALAAIDYLDKCKAYRECTNDEAAASLLSDLNFDILNPPERIREPLKVWESLLNHMELKDLIKNLVKCYKLGLLTNEKRFGVKVVEMLTDAEKIQQSGLQPIDIFFGLKYFENGGKSKDPHLLMYLKHLIMQDDDRTFEPNTRILVSMPISCPYISDALGQAVELSYTNFANTGKRYSINIVLDKNRITALNNIDALEAAAIFTMPYVVVEKDVVVTEQYRHNCFRIESQFSSFNQTIADFKSAAKRRGPTNWSNRILAFDYAIQNKLQIDVFIHVTGPPVQSVKSAADSLNRYKKEMNMPLTKLILVNFSSTKRVDYDESVLSVQGFHANIPRIIDAFVKNLF